MTLTDPTAGDEILATWGQAVHDWVNLRASRVAATGNISTTQTQIAGVTLPANTLAVGSTFRLECWGVCTSDGTNSVTFRTRCGPTTLTGNIAGTRAPNATATAAGEAFRIEFLFTVRTAGASGTCLAQSIHQGLAAEPFNSAMFLSAVTATVAVDTTVENVLELTVVTGAVGTTVNLYSAAIERVR